MSDIGKLRDVIRTLESQSAEVQQFGGVVKEIGKASDQIASSRESLLDLAQEHQNVAAQNEERFQEHAEKLERLGEELTKVVSRQNELLESIKALNILSPDKYEKGRHLTEERLAGFVGSRADDLEQSLSGIRRLQRWLFAAVVASAIGLGAFMYWAPHSFLG